MCPSRGAYPETFVKRGESGAPNQAVAGLLKKKTWKSLKKVGIDMQTQHEIGQLKTSGIACLALYGEVEIGQNVEDRQPAGLLRKKAEIAE